MIVIIDYGRGNLFSLRQALRHVGAASEVVDDPRRLDDADAILLPGVGAFGEAMKALRAGGFVEPLLDNVARGKPLLGVCLGMQLFASRSEEFGDHEGLGLIPGPVRRLPEGAEMRIPNIGWRTMAWRDGNDYGAAAGDGMAYFVHSYAIEPDDMGQTNVTIDFNGRKVVAGVQAGNVVGFQFHPEKSADVGLRLIRHFADANGLVET